MNVYWRPHQEVYPELPREPDSLTFDEATDCPLLWLRKGFGFAGAWAVCEQNRLLALCFGLSELNKPLPCPLAAFATRPPPLGATARRRMSKGQERA